MARRTFRVQAAEPLLDIGSYARRGPGRRDRLSQAQVAQISRTVKRVPEVMVKVLSRASNDFGSVGRHLGYIGRHGGLPLETDDGEQLQGKHIARELMEDWDLDLSEHRRQADLASANGRQAPKLVHKLMLSMPPGTPAQGLLAAARNFLREEFALKHRYAFALHTDEPHPHVHVVVKAVSEDGVRLHIRKATLRDWRREFARHLREQGIAANATERAVRGQTEGHKLDGIYRAMKDPNRDSTHMERRVGMVATELLKGDFRVEAGKSKLVETRREIARGWQAISEILIREGQQKLADDVRRFAEVMPPPLTEKERIAAELTARARDARPKERPVGR
jgi:hypothetical protein